MADDSSDTGGAIGGFVGSIVGMLMSQGKYDEVAKLREESMKRYGDISLPALERLARSKLNDVSMDGQYKDAGDEALRSMMDIANSNGNDAHSLARMNEAKSRAFGVQRGMQGASDQLLMRRGQLDSGAAVAGSQRAAQAGVDRAYQGNIAAAGDASDRALQALMAGGRMAESMGQNDLAQKNRVANADDRIAEFNSGAAGRKFNRDIQLASLQNGVSDKQATDAYMAAERIRRDSAGVGRGIGAAAGAAYDEYGDEEAPPMRKKYNDGYGEYEGDWEKGG